MLSWWLEFFPDTRHELPSLKGVGWRKQKKLQKWRTHNTGLQVSCGTRDALLAAVRRRAPFVRRDAAPGTFVSNIGSFPEMLVVVAVGKKTTSQQNKEIHCCVDDGDSPIENISTSSAVFGADPGSGQRSGSLRVISKRQIHVSLAEGRPGPTASSVFHTNVVPFLVICMGPGFMVTSGDPSCPTTV